MINTPAPSPPRSRVAPFSCLRDDVSPELLAALRRLYPGRRLYIPQTYDARSPRWARLAEAAGERAVVALIRKYRGLQLCVPLTPPGVYEEKRARVAALSRAGWSVARIAEELVCCERSVYRIRRKLGIRGRGPVLDCAAADRSAADRPALAAPA